MARVLRAMALAVGMLSGLTPQAGQAQPPSAGLPSPGAPNNRPAVSPYLNLVRPGGSASLNYHTLVRPQIRVNQSLQQLQQTTLRNQQAISQLAEQSPLPDTGHGAGFMQHQGYFMNNSAYFMTNQAAGRGQSPASGGTKGAGASPRTGTQARR